MVVMVVMILTNVNVTDALMSEVDGENRDEDGFLHMSYSGEANASGSINHEQEWMDKALPGFRR